MKTVLVTVIAAGVLAGCANSPSTSDKVSKSSSKPASIVASSAAPSGPASSASTLRGYQHDLALHIAEANASKVYPGRPQALLRSVIVLKYTVDGHGNLMRSEIIRSNHDSATEATALHSLRSSAPFPRPASHLLQHGQVEISETWLFNNDGRFQLRTIAQPQMDR